MNRSLLLATIAILFAGCGSESEQLATGKEHLRVSPTSVKVERRDIVGYVLLDGQLYVPPDKQALVKAPYASNVEQVLVHPGKRVARGETLVKMELPEYQAYFAQSKSNLQAAESAYQSALAQYSGPARVAERQLAQARSTERTLRQQAAANGDATDLNAAIEARQAAEQAAIQARADRDSQVLTYRQQLDQARRDFEQAKTGVRQANVTSPINGTVVDLHAVAGQPADNSTVIATVVDLSSIQVKADLTRAAANVVDKDTRVVVTFAGLSDKPFDGVVTEVRTLPADTTGVKRVATIDFENDSGMIKPGMEVKSVGAKVGQVHNALAVPVDAVFNDKTGKACVRIAENGEWVVRVIEIGLSDGFFTQVKSGLDQGDTVLVPGRN